MNFQFIKKDNKFIVRDRCDSSNLKKAIKEIVLNERPGRQRLYPFEFDISGPKHLENLAELFLRRVDA